MRIKRVSDEVLVAEEPLLQVSRQDVERLKEQGRQNARKRIRLCAHRDLNEVVHEMLIVHGREAYVRPHKHMRKTESFHVIEGQADIVIFDEGGDVTEVIQMGDYTSGRRFYYRMAEAWYHTVLIRSDVFVFHETASGPFQRSDTVFAPWAPDEHDRAATDAFMRRLAESIETFQSHGLPSSRRTRA